MACQQAGEHAFPSQGPSSDIVIADFGMYVPWTFSLETCPVCVLFDLVVPTNSIPLRDCSPPSQEGWIMSPQEYSI